MSNEVEKEKRGKRILGNEHAIRKQVKIAKAYGMTIEEAHRYVKHHALNCGDPKCIMCSNPRKTFKEKTIQEKRFYQKELYDQT
jgi:hypothetical protein